MIAVDAGELRAEVDLPASAGKSPALSCAGFKPLSQVVTPELTLVTRPVEALEACPGSVITTRFALQTFPESAGGDSKKRSLAAQRIQIRRAALEQ